MDNVDTAAPAGAGPVNRDDLAGLFRAELEAENAPPAEAKPAETSADPSETGQNDAAAPDIEAAADPETSDEDVAAEDAEPEAEPEVATAQPAIEAPSGMSDADKANFAKLTPELKTWLSKTKHEADVAFTRKSQEAAEVRKAADAKYTALSGAMEKYDAVLRGITDTHLEPPDPALIQTDPFAYEEQRAHYERAKHRQESAKAEVERNAKAHQVLMDKQRTEWLTEQATLLNDLAPDLADTSEKGQKLKAAVSNYALQNGYSKEQLVGASALDVSVLLKAMRYDAAQKAKTQSRPPASPPPKVSTPGPSKAAGGRPSSLAKAVINVAQSGSRESLAQAFLAEIQSERR